MARPSSTPPTQASPNPAPTRISVAARWFHSVPRLASSTSWSQITSRLGNRRGLTRPERAISSHSSSTTATEYQRPTMPSSARAAGCHPARAGAACTWAVLAMAPLRDQLADQQPVAHREQQAVASEPQDGDGQDRREDGVEAAAGLGIED